MGIIFHVPPSNIPTNFAYSFVFGIFTGNTNIIRLSKNTYFHTRKSFANNIRINSIKIQNLKEIKLFLYYDRDEDINKKLSKLADSRMIWGSNKTINKFKLYSTKPYCRDT